jgi:hypothetical protein
VRSVFGHLLVIVAGAMLELGLAIVWLVSPRLSHNEVFTQQYLAQFPPLRQITDTLVGVARVFLPNIEPPADLNLPTGVLAVGFVVAGVGYLAGLIVLDRLRRVGSLTVVLVLAFALLFQLTEQLMPGLFSQDIFGYLEYGQIPYVHALNPYIWPPSAFAHDELLQWVAPIWRTLPSPYGPTWTDLNWALAHVLTGRSIIEQVEAYKVLANVLHLLSLGLLAWLLSRLMPGPAQGQRRLVALTVFAWNPLVLFESPGNGHNDDLALFLLLLAFVPLLLGAGRARALDARYLASVVFLTLSGFVKYLSAVVGPLLVIAWARQLPSWRARALSVVVAGIAAGVVTLLLFAPWLELPDSLDPVLSQTGGALYANALPDVVSLAVSDQVLMPRGMPVAVARATARGWMKLLVDAVFLAYLAWEIWHLWRSAGGSRVDAVRALLGSSIRLLLVVILVVSIWVQTWYFVMPLALAALLGWRSILTRTVVGYTLTALPVLYTHYYLQDDAPDAIFWLYGLLPLLVPLGAWLASVRRSDAAVEPPEVPEDTTAEPVRSLAGAYDT